MMSPDLSSTTLAVALVVHYQMLKIADDAARNIFKQVQTLNTTIYDGAEGWGGRTETTPAFWSNVAELEHQLLDFQTQLHEVGLAFAEKPAVELVQLDGTAILYGDLVVFKSIDDRPLDALEAQLHQKAREISAEIEQTEADLESHQVDVPAAPIGPPQPPLYRYQPSGPSQSNERRSSVGREFILIIVAIVGRILFELLINVF